MDKESFYLESNCDGLKIYVTTYIPKGKIKGIVQFSHGMAEHQTYYYDFMEFLCNNGYLCVINDHRGHGKSVKNINDLGYFYEENGDYVVEDLHQVTEYIKDKYKNLKVCLFGHSMGSLIARKYIKKYDKDIDKLIVCGSPSVKRSVNFGLLSCRLFKLFKGDKYRSKFLNGMALTNDSADKWLTTNMDYAKKYMTDKYCNYIFTVNGFITLVYLSKDVYSKKNWSLNNKDLDIYFIAGRDDIVIKSEKEFMYSINFIKNIGYNNVTYKLYDNCKHAIFMDNTEEVYKDVLDFIEK